MSEAAFRPAGDERRSGLDRRHAHRVGGRSTRLAAPAAEVRERLQPAFVLIVLTVADLLTTAALRGRGGSELNPIGRWLIGHDILVVAKLAAVSVVTVLLLGVPAGRRWIVNGLWFVAGMYATVIGLHVWQLVLG